MDDTLILHHDGLVSVSDKHNMIGAGTTKDSLDLVEWVIGVRSMSVFENTAVFSSDGRLVKVVVE